MPMTFVFLPGIWHQASTFNAVRALIPKEYETISETLPRVAANDYSKVGLADDIKFVSQSLLMPLLDDGKGVVVVMHSYGGLPGSAAVEGLSKDERQKHGQKGGIVGLIYLAALLVPEGKNNASFWEEMVPGYAANYISVAEDMSYTFITPENARKYLLGDLSTIDADKHYAQLRKHSAAASLNDVPYTAWSKPEWASKCRFIETTTDRIVSRSTTLSPFPVF